MEDKFFNENSKELELEDLAGVAGGIKWGGNKDVSQLDPKLRKLAEDREEEAPNRNKSSLADFFAANRK